MAPQSRRFFDDADSLLDRQLLGMLPRAGPAFFGRFGRLTEVQRQAIPTILSGRNVLVSASTAAGKTEAACAPLVENQLKGAGDTPWFLLYVAPTRALVNDIYERLRRPLTDLGVKTIRRTGDHKDRIEKKPSVIVTTPESFESMMCSRSNWLEDGTMHPLALVSAAILDEIHLLQANPRGEQLRILLERLRRLRRQAMKILWTRSADLQIVALSATVTNPERTRSQFLGEGEEVVVHKPREMAIVAPDVEIPATEEAIVNYVSDLGSKDEKILVFSNSRRRVDDLTAFLKRELAPHRYEVFAHHGSLGQGLRESAEKAAKCLKRVLLVATSTLELGIDIGDIDLVVLDGPAPDVSSLLQRVGRGGRRTDTTRLMLCASSLCEILINSAMLRCAREGDLGPPFEGPQFAVLVQQVACYILQGEKRDRPRKKLVDLLAGTVGPESAETLLKHVVDQGLFKEENGRIRLGQDLLDGAKKGTLFSNIESNFGPSVVDNKTGKIVATGIQFRRGTSLNLGGQSLQIRSWKENKILVNKASKHGSGDAEWSYTSKAWAKGPGQPDALRKYLGIEPDHWPVIHDGEQTLIFHLGGARRQAVIDLAARLQRQALVVNEWFIRFPHSVQNKPSWLADLRDSAVDLQISHHLERLERELGRPRANQQLPHELRVREVREWLSAPQEVRAIRKSCWKLCGDPDTEQVLRWFGRAVGDLRKNSQEAGDLPDHCIP